jgi:hypothetical protein
MLHYWPLSPMFEKAIFQVSDIARLSFQVLLQLFFGFHVGCGLGSVRLAADAQVKDAMPLVRSATVQKSGHVHRTLCDPSGV